MFQLTLTDLMAGGRPYRPVSEACRLGAGHELKKTSWETGQCVGGFAGVGVGLVGPGSGVDLNSAELAPQYLGGASPLECGEESAP